MEHFIITISRQYASGGAKIGELVSQKLNLPFWDRNRLDEIAHERGIDHTYIPVWQPKVSSMEIWGACDLTRRMWGFFPSKANPAYYSNEREMFHVQSRLIYEFAESGPCVFVGRCADYILKHWKNCLRVFIHADEDSRALRMYDEYYERTGSLSERMRIIDEGRAAYYKRNTGQIWGARKNYHLFLDSGFLGIQGCVDAIVSAAASRWNGNCEKPPV